MQEISGTKSCLQCTIC